MLEIKLLSMQESIMLDKQTIEGGFVTGKKLMDNAGKAIADNLLRIIKERNFSEKVLFLAGKGNNGGDAFVAAKYFKDYGFNPCLILTVLESELKNEALFYYEKFKSELDISILINVNDIAEKINSFNPKIIIDGLLGTGFKPPLNEFYSSLIQFLNKRKIFTVSIDIPSGIASNQYENVNTAKIKADETLSIGSVKQEFFLRENIEFCGKIIPLTIGFPANVVNSFSSLCNIYGESKAKETLKRRNSYSHKGTYGHVLIIGGKTGYLGALLLSGLSALRGGAGLLTLCTEEHHRIAIYSALKEAMTISINELLYFEKDLDVLKKYNAIAIGPGLTINENSKVILEFILRNTFSPILLDADALNILATNPSILNGIKRDIILTPHPGEAARLLNCKTIDIESDRLNAATTLVKKYNASVILKGSNTITSFHDESFLHLTGSPLMATGGMGDVLTGLCVSLLGQGLNIKEALNLAVYLHGKSGEILEIKEAPYGILAGELANQIPYTIKNVLL